VAAVAAALGIDRLIVIGYSMGGLIAQLVWQRHRQLTAGLVLCATARSMAGSHLTPSAALLPPALTTPGPALPGWTLPGLGTAALTLAATQGWLAAVAVLRADLLGRYLLDAGGDPARRAWALAQMRRTPLVSALAAVSAVYHHYNRRRPHRALQLQPPRPDLPAPNLGYRRIRRRPVLGGLINEYERAA
jgi:pimeloyl-ACP methyl ester carboxylesterase